MPPLYSITLIKYHLLRPQRQDVGCLQLLPVVEDDTVNNIAETKKKKNGMQGQFNKKESVNIIHPIIKVEKTK